jgi:hypothetical protein
MCIRLGIPVLADRGYQGAGDTVAVPHRRRPGKDVTVKQRCVNRAHSRLRLPVERSTASVKTGRILAKPAATTQPDDVYRQSHPHPREATLNKLRSSLFHPAP